MTLQTGLVQKPFDTKDITRVNKPNDTTQLNKSKQLNTINKS